jgi:hypothetical protein
LALARLAGQARKRKEEAEKLCKKHKADLDELLAWTRLNPRASNDRISIEHMLHDLERLKWSSEDSIGIIKRMRSRMWKEKSDLAVREATKRVEADERREAPGGRRGGAARAAPGGI